MDPATVARLPLPRRVVRVDPACGESGRWVSLVILDCGHERLLGYQARQGSRVRCHVCDRYAHRAYGDPAAAS